MCCIALRSKSNVDPIAFFMFLAIACVMILYNVASVTFKHAWYCVRVSDFVTLSPDYVLVS